MTGPAPIEHRDIEAFQHTTRFRFRPWEVEALEDLDDAYLMAMAEVQRQDAEGTKPIDDPDQVRDIPRRPVIRKQGGAP